MNELHTMEYAGIADEDFALGIIIMSLDDCVQLARRGCPTRTDGCVHLVDPQVMPGSSATVAITAVTARPRLL